MTLRTISVVRLERPLATLELGAAELAAPRVFDLATGGPQFTLRAPTIAGFEGTAGTVTTRVVEVHGNSKLSQRTAHLYELYKKDGTFQKYGISQDPYKRYSGDFMKRHEIYPITSGSRSEMLVLEREMVTANPGPLNNEPWAKAAKAAGRGQ